MPPRKAGRKSLVSSDIDNTNKKKSRTSTAQAHQNDFEEDFHEDIGTQIVDDIFMPPPPIHPNLNDDQTGNRLVIDTIEITNFKSYGGRVVLGPFQKSFNSIVGPNGSGKSNVIDSMLFVFGYRASKIRSAKITNLIHNSDTLGNLDFAKVTVNFAMIDDKGGLDHDIIENSRFSISRIVEKPNTSYYLIGSSRVGFRDVSKKLEEFGIDLRYNRFLILQGEVEQISLMKPKADTPNDTGMLEFLEDIIGTSRYKEPIERLSSKYVEFNEERVQFVNRVKLASSELKSVSEAKDEAVRALKLENEKKIQRSHVYQLNLYKVKMSMEKYEVEYSTEKTKLDELNQKLEEMETKRVTLDTDEKTKSKEYKRLQAEQTTLKEQFNECGQKDYYLNTKRKTTKDKLKKLSKKIEEEISKVAELRAIADENHDNEQVSKLEKQQMELEAKSVENEQEMKNQTEEAEKECSELITKRDELNLALMQFKAEQTDKLNAMNQAGNQVSILREREQHARSKYEQTISKLHKVEEESAEKTATIERYQREIPDEEKRLVQLNKNLYELEKKKAEIHEEITAKNDDLQEMRRAANQAESRDRLVNAFKQEVAKGRLHGIFGRLGDLGAIDAKYDVAISTACGSLRNFVVDTMDNAVEAVNFMKKNNHPPQSFMALDKMRNVCDAPRGGYPEGVPRLFDLVRVKEKQYLPAFYHALGETLVANDLEQASRIGYGAKRYRVVTLKGEIIEPSGSMSGGGRPRSGGMSSSIAQETVADASVIDELQEKVDQLRASREQVSYQQDSLRKEITNLERDLKIMRERFAGFKLEIDDNVKRLEKFRENLVQQKKELEVIEANPEMAEAEIEFQKRKKVYEKEEAKMTKQQSELSDFQNQIEERLSSRLEPIKKRKKDIEKKKKEIQAALNKILTERKASELTLKKTEESLAANEATKIELEEEMKKITKEVAELEVRAKDVTDRYEKSKDKCATFEAEFSAITKELKQLEEMVKKLKSSKLDLNHELEKKFKVFEDKRSKVAALKAELDALVLDEVDFDDDDDDDDWSDDETDNEEEEGNDGQEGDMGDNENVETICEEPMDVDGDDRPRTEVEKSTEEVQENGKSRKKTKKKKGPPTIPTLSVEELNAVNPATVERTIESIESELKKLGQINYAAIEQYRIKRAEHKERLKELSGITAKRDTYMEHLNATKAMRQSEFKIGFMMIARKLKELYRTITLGGDADLEFIDSLDPFSEGINFAVRPNKKSWKNNINLSGGEKTLASLALIFALHYYKPSPLYIMDEIDAALDFKNVSIIANYIKQRTRNTQFLIISLRNNMYELAEMLIGVYKTFNVSKTIAFDPIAYAQKHEPTTLIEASQPVSSATTIDQGGSSQKSADFPSQTTLPTKLAPFIESN